MRLTEHPLLRFERGGREVTIYFNGRPIKAYEGGETIATALHAAGIRALNYSVNKKRPRGGLFCAIGKCSSCLMVVNGIPNVRACITPVEDGMRIQPQHGRARLPEKAKPPEFRDAKVVRADIVIIGGGPAGGLMAAIHAADAGASVALLDENPRLGGQLIKQTHKFFGKREQFAGVRGGVEIAKILSEELRKRENVQVFLETSAVGIFQEKDEKLVFAVRKNREPVEFRGRAIIVATARWRGAYPSRTTTCRGSTVPGPSRRS